MSSKNTLLDLLPHTSGPNASSLQSSLETLNTINEIIVNAFCDNNIVDYTVTTSIFHCISHNHSTPAAHIFPNVNEI